MIVITGPSASGKTATCLFLQAHFGIRKVVTHTTRAMRVGEKDGVDYHFVSKDEFLAMKSKDEFVETVCYNDNFYGTSKKEVRIDKCLAVELNGAKVYKSLDDPRIVLFYLRANEKMREERMRERGDAPEKIVSRLDNDRKVFQLDEETKKLIDCYVDTETHTLEEVSRIIFTKYVEILKARGIEFKPECQD